MKLNVTQTHLRIAVLVLAGVLILYAVLKLAFGMNFGPLIETNLPNAIMLGAAGIFVWNRMLWNQAKKKEEEEAAAKKAAEKTDDQDAPPS